MDIRPLCLARAGSGVTLALRTARPPKPAS
jgi:hypothetical protein